jgi:hypothetical protein
MNVTVPVGVPLPEAGFTVVSKLTLTLAFAGTEL